MEKQDNNGAPVEKKRKRSANWDSMEKNLLRYCINGFIHIIENKNTDTNINKAKNAAWQKITERFNELNHAPRNVNEIKQQWRTTKLDAKRKLSLYKKARNETGGGPKVPSPDHDTAAIVEMIPKEFETDFNQFDSDGIILEGLKTHSKTVETEISIVDYNNDVIQDKIKNSTIHKNECMEQGFVEPTPSPSPSRDQKSKVRQSKKKLPYNINELVKQRNEALIQCIEEEHTLKIIHMRESHQWARDEHILQMKKLEMEIELLKKKLNNNLG